MCRANRNQEIKGVQTPWDGLIPELLAEHYNVISAGMARRPARMEVVDFSDAVYFFGPHLMVLKGNPKAICTAGKTSPPRR